MGLPARVRTALRLGHALAAKVPGTCSGGQAWVWVAPVMRSGKTYQQVLDKWTLRHEASEAYDDSILRYKVRYLELSHWNVVEDYNYALDFVERDRAVQDVKAEVVDAEALERWLAQHLDDLTLLRMPSSVEYYFDNNE